MNDKNIEEFLRNCRPAVKEDPTFILETRRRLETVEGIKEEVDRQRRHGRTAILIALFLGVLAGILVMAATILFPEVTAIFKERLQLLWVALAILAVTLGLVLSSDLQGRRSRTIYP